MSTCGPISFSGRRYVRLDLRHPSVCLLVVFSFKKSSIGMHFPYKFPGRSNNVVSGDFLRTQPSHGDFFFSQSHRIRSSSIDFYYISLALCSSIELVTNAILLLWFWGKNTKLGCIVNNHQLPARRRPAMLKGACTNHVDRILGNFDPPPPMWTLLLNSCY